MKQGVDYAWSTPDPVAMRNMGIEFACRYVGAGTPDKHLTREEALKLNAAGIDLIALCEGFPNDALNGMRMGVDHASWSILNLHDIGAPSGTIIYFSVDFDCTSAQWPHVRDYLDGAASVIGFSKVGVYGSDDVMRWARNAGCASHFFRTYAWASQVPFIYADLEQHQNGVLVPGGEVDLCRSNLDYFGQFRVDGKPVGTSSNGGTDVIGQEVWAYVGQEIKDGKPAGVLLSDTADRIYTLVNTAMPSVASDLAKIIASQGQPVQPVDANAVASALIGDPTFITRLADAIAARLPVKSGSISLTGQWQDVAASGGAATTS